MPEKKGAPRIARGAAAPQEGQASGRSYSAIGREAVKGPQEGQA
jgi:hypothetical protein